MREKCPETELGEIQARIFHLENMINNHVDNPEIINRYVLVLSCLVLYCLVRGLVVYVHA